MARTGPPVFLKRRTVPPVSATAGGILAFLLLPAMLLGHAAAQSYTYAVQAGTDYYGNDFHPVDGPTNPGVCGPVAYGADPSACEALCNAAASCAGFVHVADNNCCLLKNVMANPTPLGRTIAHLKTGYPGYIIEYGKNYAGNDIVPSAAVLATVPMCPGNSAATQESVGACVTRCNNYGPGCVGVLYDVNPEAQCCFLKSTLANKAPAGNAVAYTKSPAYTYDVQTATDYYGNDFHPLDGPSNLGVCGPGGYSVDPSACEALCNAAAACAGFVYVADNNCCLLKNVMATPTALGRTIAHLKTGYPGYTVEYGQDYQGINIDIAPPAGSPMNVPTCGDHATQESVGACIARCDNNPACAGIAYTADNSCCYIKNAQANKTPYARVTSYKKTPCPPGHAGPDCHICDPGTFSSGGSPQTSVCQPCADFSIAPNSGSSSCQQCPAGYGTDFEKSRCIECRSACGAVSMNTPIGACRTCGGRCCKHVNGRDVCCYL